MSRNFFRTIVLILSCVLASLSSSHLFAQTAYAVTAQGNLVRFDLSTPGTFTSSTPITGLGTGESITAIDFRPATGQLYGLGTASRLYVIDINTGVATQVGGSGSFTLIPGGQFGFDFNPTVDRIRVVGESDQNFRINPDTGLLAATDTNLAYAVGDVNAGQDPGVAASGYTNNFAGATSTTLYGIDKNRDVLVIQNPPNAGVLNTVGPLGVDSIGITGLDIVRVNGVDTAFAVMQVASPVFTEIYRIDLATGAATLVGYPAGGAIIVDIAIVPDTPRLVNIATRGQVLTGDNVMISGFVIGGSGSKEVAVVVTGPSLAAFGIANPLANPTLRLVRQSDGVVLAVNDDWQNAANSAQLVAAGFAPSHPQEAAILISLPPGAYTAVVEGAGGGTGVAVAAVYEVSRTDIPLVNLATRGIVLTGENVMIGGFVIQGSIPQKVAIVGTGPSLAAFGIAGPLANPKLTLVRSSDQAVLAINDDWGTAPNAPDVIAFGFAPTHPQESVIYMTLPPGAYTAILEGVGGGTGVGVVAVYRSN